MKNSKMIDQDTIGMELGARCHRIVRLPNGWRIWLATRDYKFGTFIELSDQGRAVRFVTRIDQGDEIYQVRPSDAEIKRWHSKQ